MKEVITSRDNQLARRARAVREGRVQGQIFIEGLRLSLEAARASLAIDSVICTERFARDERGARLFPLLGKTIERISLVSEAVFASLSDTKSPQGVVILAARPHTGRAALEQAIANTPLFVIMHQLNNPSNAGAILRTAEAAGATGAATTHGTTDLFSPKALRGAMGSSFRLPLWIDANFEELIGWCKRRGIQIIGTDLRAERTHTEIDWTHPSALVVGSEAIGIKPVEAAATDERVRIPMRAPVESLNVAVATSILLYEAERQRTVSGWQ
ncbi:MAG TPA: RNA methyltransferase [Pyrinomonadaceae bacterium]|jgi:TrmH family RNA methyltransferase